MGLTEEQKTERETVTQNITTFDSLGEDDYVFISYKSDDWKIVLDEVVRYMVEHYGLRVYFDRNFDRDNDIWINNMKKAITTRKCRAVLAFVSKTYMTSYACVMELLTARSKQAQMSFEETNYQKLQIIPIIIDESGSVRGAMSKSGEHVPIKEREKYLEILKDAKESPWVQDDKKLMPWMDRLAKDQEWTEENFSNVAEIILSEGHERYFSRKGPNFYEDLRQTIERCSKDVFDPALIKKGTAKAEKNEKLKGMEKPPKYMQSVKFCCKKNQCILGDQRRELEMIFTNEYESFENESLEDIEAFIDTYVGRDMDTGEIFDYEIKDDYLWIHLNESERFLYDGECLQKTLNALNRLLRQEVFERFEAWGYDED